MDIEDIVSQLKERGTIIREPRRLRRKPKERVLGEEARADRAEKRARRRAYKAQWWRSVSGSYYNLRKSYRLREKKRIAKGAKPLEFKLSLEDWKRLWEAAGTITQADGSLMPVFKLRGRGKDSAKLWRIDDQKPWQLDNVIVLYRGRVVANGRALAKNVQ